jgi:hypothetical protein
MKTAMMSASLIVGEMEATGGCNNTAAVESAVDAYATRVLEHKSPSGTFVDTSLGPYVTALLRCSGITHQDEVTSFGEFDSLLELLEDQCSMDGDNAKSALLIIADAVCTGMIPNEHKKHNSHGGATRLGPYSGGGLDSFRILGKSSGYINGVQTGNIAGYETSIPLQLDPCTPNSAGGPSPLKPDNLIPVDLLGVLDDQPPQFSHSAVPETFPLMDEPNSTNHDEAFPPLGALVASTAPSKKGMRGAKKGSKTQQSKDKDLAAALFRPARPRRNSIEKEDSSPGLNPQTTPRVKVAEVDYNEQYYHQRLGSAVEILLSMTPDLGEEAAVEAAVLANTDFNLAHYIVDAALTAPPVCRHMLHDGCYRSDCQFSHDVEGHTCLFWLRGRCGKGLSCKFLHGFNSKLLEGINTAIYVDQNSQVDSSTYELNSPYSGGYDSSHHMMTPLSLSSQGGGGYDQEQSRVASSWEAPAESAISFANVATKGYDESKFSSPTLSESMGVSSVPTVKIPQDLWNPSENRDSSVFHVADPIERYHRVASRVVRLDVIDLHFQSTKTFAIVLATIIPQKLSQLDEVWVVTGTGHHVGTKTHQKGGGALERAVMAWLLAEGYSIAKGRDRNGMGGAILVKR